MKISISLNPFDKLIHLTIRDLPGITSKQFYEIAQIADHTLQKNIEKYLEFINIMQENEKEGDQE